MLESLNDNNIFDYLSAFVDGELDGAQSAALWNFLTDHPNRPAMLSWLQDLQQLSAVSRRTIVTQTPPSVHERVRAILDSPSSPANEAAAPIELKPSRVRRLWIRQTLGCAASLVIGMAIILAWPHGSPTKAADVLPVDFIVKVGRIHSDCSRLPLSDHDATFEQIDAPLASVVKADLGKGNAAPDFSSIGFRFVGAGPCPASKISTDHLLYRTATVPSAAISVFVQADHGQFPALLTGKMYRASAVSSPYPMLAWRDGKAVFFLLADDERMERAALALLRPTPDDEIIQLAAR